MRTIGNCTIRRKGEGVSYGSGSNVKQLCDWDMAGTDDAAAVETAGFFNDMAGELQVGEYIFARLDLADTPVGKIYMVDENTGSAVTVAEITVTHPE